MRLCGDRLFDFARKMRLELELGEKKKRDTGVTPMIHEEQEEKVVKELLIG